MSEDSLDDTLDSSHDNVHDSINATTPYDVIDDNLDDSDYFTNMSSEYDRFTYVIVCYPNGSFYQAVPYMYARNIARVRESLSLISVDDYIEHEQYAIKGELLKLLSLNPIMICSLIAKQDNILLSLHQELIELENLEMLDGHCAESLGKRLISFLKIVKVGNYDGDGIFWLPENYLGEEADDIEINEDEDEDDYTRRVICRHIKQVRLPMAHIIPIPQDRMNMMNELISSIGEYNTDLKRIAQLSHFVPLFRNRGDITKAGLKILMAEEFRCVKNEEYVDNKSLFIFDSEQLDMNHETIPTYQAIYNLRYYVGDYFDALDLSNSFITGSSITASLICTQRDSTYDSRETMIDLLYPKVITDIPEQVIDDLREDNINLWNINAVSDTIGIMTKGTDTIKFTIKSGSDVDIAVDNTVTDDEYAAIAIKHFEVIRKYYPYVKMREIVKPKGDCNYVIYTDNPNYIPVFRVVEIYRSSFRNICSHHVGSVRGCYTSKWSKDPKFYLTASGVLTSMTNATPNYHYFAGRKSNPQDIIIKNRQRGIMCLDEVLNTIMDRYCDQMDIKGSHMPFYFGRKVSYSIFATALEYPFVSEKRRKERERQIKAEQAAREKHERKVRSNQERERQRITLARLDHERLIAEREQEERSVRERAERQMKIENRLSAEDLRRIHQERLRILNAHSDFNQTARYQAMENEKAITEARREREAGLEKERSEREAARNSLYKVMQQYEETIKHQIMIPGMQDVETQHQTLERWAREKRERETKSKSEPKDITISF